MKLPKDNRVETNNNNKQQQKEPYLEFPSLLRLAANGGRLLRGLLYKLSERGWVQPEFVNIDMQMFVRCQNLNVKHKMYNNALA